MSKELIEALQTRKSTRELAHQMERSSHWPTEPVSVNTVNNNLLSLKKGDAGWWLRRGKSFVPALAHRLDMSQEELERALHDLSRSTGRVIGDGEETWQWPWFEELPASSLVDEPLPDFILPLELDTRLKQSERSRMQGVRSDPIKQILPGVHEEDARLMERGLMARHGFTVWDVESGGAALGSVEASQRLLIHIQQVESWETFLADHRRALESRSGDTVVRLGFALGDVMGLDSIVRRENRYGLDSFTVTTGDSSTRGSNRAVFDHVQERLRAASIDSPLLVHEERCKALLDTITGQLSRVRSESSRIALLGFLHHVEPDRFDINEPEELKRGMKRWLKSRYDKSVGFSYRKSRIEDLGRMLDAGLDEEWGDGGYPLDTWGSFGPESPARYTREEVREAHKRGEIDKLIAPDAAEVVKEFEALGLLAEVDEGRHVLTPDFVLELSLRVLIKQRLEQRRWLELLRSGELLSPLIGGLASLFGQALIEGEVPAQLEALLERARGEGRALTWQTMLGIEASIWAIGWILTTWQEALPGFNDVQHERLCELYRLQVDLLEPRTGHYPLTALSQQILASEGWNVWKKTMLWLGHALWTQHPGSRHRLPEGAYHLSWLNGEGVEDRGAMRQLFDVFMGIHDRDFLGKGEAFYEFARAIGERVPILLQDHSHNVIFFAHCISRLKAATNLEGFELPKADLVSHAVLDARERWWVEDDRVDERLLIVKNYIFDSNNLFHQAERWPWFWERLDMTSLTSSEKKRVLQQPKLYPLLPKMFWCGVMELIVLLDEYLLKEFAEYLPVDEVLDICLFERLDRSKWHIVKVLLENIASRHADGLVRFAEEVIAWEDDHDKTFSFAFELIGPLSEVRPQWLSDYLQSRGREELVRVAAQEKSFATFLRRWITARGRGWERGVELLYESIRRRESTSIE